MADTKTVEFDPDAYLAMADSVVVEEPSNFDVDAYLSAKEAEAIPEQAAPVAMDIPRPDATSGPTNRMDPFARTGFLMTSPAGRASTGRAAHFTKNIGLEGGGATLGQILGAPFAPVGGVQIGGALLGSAGNAIGQLTTPGKKFSLGEMAGAAVAGTVPGVSLAKAGTAEVGKQALKYGAANLAAKTTQTAIDENRLPTIGEGITAAGAGALAAPLSKFLDKGLMASASGIKAGNASAERASLEGGRKLGLVAPPSATNQNAINDAIQSLAGKAAVNQAAVLKNQPVVNSVFRKELGIPEGTALSVESLNTAAVAPNLVYDQVAAMTPASDGLLAAFKKAQANANALYGAYRSQLAQGVHRPDLKDQAEQLLFDAKTFERNLANEAKKVPGGPELMERFYAAREKLAKIGLAKQGLVHGSGNIDPKVIGDAFEDAPQRLSGDIKKLGAFQSAFSRYVKDATSAPSPGVDYLKLLSKGALFGGGWAMGNPLLAVGGPLALYGAERGARKMILSPGYQNQMGRPSYGPVTEDAAAGIARLGALKVGREPDQTNSETEEAPLSDKEYKRYLELKAKLEAVK